jgi:hypothetical protein
MDVAGSSQTPQARAEYAAVRAWWPVVAVVISAAVISGCASGPSTKDEVSKTFDELGTQLIQGNGVFGNPLFHKAGELGDLAARYPGQSLTADAEALKAIADSSSTSGGQLMAATGRITDLCGHPLGVNAFGS